MLQTVTITIKAEEGKDELDISSVFDPELPAVGSMSAEEWTKTVMRNPARVLGLTALHTITSLMEPPQEQENKIIV